MKLTAEHSFPDAAVMEWSSTPTKLEITMSEVFYEGQSHGPATLRFTLLRPATAMSYDNEQDNWLDLGAVEPLKDICEFHHESGNHYSLNGFGSITGRWITVRVEAEMGEISWAS